MDDVQDFNSSDIDFSDPEPPPPDWRKPGHASIQKMIENGEKDRISSKRTVKTLTLQGAAPSTRNNQSLWVTRFVAFRENTLHQSADSPFTGDDMIRFLDSMMSKMQLKDRHKTAPSLITIQNAYKILLTYGTFRWSREQGFRITSHDGSRFKAFTIKAVHEKRLTKGRWREKTWIGFVTLSRLVRAFLGHFVKNGALNFDVVISKCMSVVLIASLSCRVGDVARSRGYTGNEYLRYEHIELYLEAPAPPADPQQQQEYQPRFEDLRAIVTLEYTKGHKDKDNDSVTRYLRPLGRESVHVCPIALLLVHTLRNGLVHGTTLEEVLAHTAARPDLCVEWKYPKRPVLTIFARKPSRCDLDAVPLGQQVTDTVKQMGLISGMLSRSYGHSLRLGGIRDYAHLSKDTSKMLPSTDDVRRFSGHTSTAMQKGSTEDYIGDVAQEYYNDRAEGGGVVHRREPKFALDEGGSSYLETVQQRVSAEEMQAELDEDQPGRDVASLTSVEKRTIQEHVRRKRREALASSTLVEPRIRKASNTTTAPPPVPPRPPPQEPSRRTVTHRPKNKPHVQHDDDLVEADQEAPTAAAPQPHVPRSGLLPPIPTGATATVPADGVPTAAAKTSSEDPAFLSKIDPALLDEDALASLAVADADVEALEAVLFPSVPGAGTADDDVEEEGGDDGAGPENQEVPQADMEEVARVLFDEDEDEEAPPPVETPSDSPGPTGWINGYARYNVVKNASLANVWKSFSEGRASFEKSVGQHSMRGDSRDEPTPYTFHCRSTKGCDYTCIKQALLDQHEMNCSAVLVEARDQQAGQPDEASLKCTHPGCTFKTFAGAKHLKKHIRLAHLWVPRECEDCDDGFLYQSQSALTRHKAKVHSGRWPSKCLYPNCPEEKDFTSHTSLVIHLKTKHGLLTGEACLPYLPPLPEKTRWVKQKCVVPTCTSTTMWTFRKGMVAHLISTHKMEDKAAEELVDREATVETFVPEKKALGPAGNAKKRDAGRAFVVAPGKENNPPAALEGVQQQGQPAGEDGIGSTLPELKKKKPRTNNTLA